jgi:cytochrome oxidase Cu insertion factor (SCO1/SenC/PrrC family)
VLVGFGCTHCPDVCPALYNTFKQIRNGMAPAMYKDVDLVIITVDSDNDTPEGLNAYSEQYGGDWHFLTEETSEQEKVVRSDQVGTICLAAP